MSGSANTFVMQQLGDSRPWEVKEVLHFAERLDGRVSDRDHAAVTRFKAPNGDVDWADSVQTGEFAGSVPPSRSEGVEKSRKRRSLGKYQFIAKLGRGGMADVHLAVSVGPAGFSKLQVIKCLRSTVADDPEFRKMLLDEARLAARLNHKNIVQTNEVGISEEEYFMAMEYLEGQPLSRLIGRCRERDHPIPMAISLWILCEVLAGLHYAHELVDYDGVPLHVVHRDVSPHNIFITYDGQVKVVDFGIALAARRDVETQAGTVKGKVAYMAPEQAFSPSSEIDRRADVFSVGVILWELIAGRRLWRGLTDPQIISRLMREVPDVRTARPEASFELSRICKQSLAIEREARYGTAAELRSELERFAERLGEQVTAGQVGELVCELFSEERAEIRSIIERQLKNLQDSEDDTEDAEATGRPSLPAIAPAEVEEDGGAAITLPRAPRTPMIPRNDISSVAPPAYRKLFVMGAGLFLLGVVSALFFLRGPVSVVETPHLPTQATTPQVRSTAPAALTQTAESVHAPASALIRAKVSVTPRAAKILVDGSALPSNPFEGKFIKDDAAHRLQMEAPGFYTQSQMVVFDKDIELEVTLYPVQKGSSSASAAAPAGTTTLPPLKPDPY